MKILPIYIKIALFIPFLGMIFYYFLKDTLMDDRKAVAIILTYHTFIVSLFIVLTLKSVVYE